ncbi:MAG: DUF429 domain-containing protein [Candidatus Altiarchaeota archaeon]|nr:DUF429 domain-containing protein [Candidatus Altiarchaeota archaeon]
MKLVGIDLAGNPRNHTGFCILNTGDNKKIVTTSILHSDSEIMEEIEGVNPDLIAVDAPLTFSGVNRRCDDELHRYGALPVTLRGMEVLAKRGTELAEKLRKKNFRVIEVYATCSGKILGFYDKNERSMHKNLMNSGLEGSIHKRIPTKDEIDAIFSALTAYLHLNGSTEEVGDENGKIIIPKV